jgi:head-tail adaptor
MRSGKMRDRVRILNPTYPAGLNQAPVYSDAGEVWAAVDPAGSNESMRQDQMLSTFSHQLVVRYSPDITTRTRLMLDSERLPLVPGQPQEWSGRRLEIVGLVNVGNRNRELQLTCLERPANG